VKSRFATRPPVPPVGVFFLEIVHFFQLVYLSKGFPPYGWDGWGKQSSAMQSTPEPLPASMANRAIRTSPLRPAADRIGDRRAAVREHVAGARSGKAPTAHGVPSGDFNSWQR
jgi:hypothetical protein